jgi:hypothetical protein
VASDHSKFPKQPYNPDRKPSESVTWVRNNEKLQNDKRPVVNVPKPVRKIVRVVK